MKFIIFLWAIMISACGMQGDLYLPDDEPVKDKSAKDRPAKNPVEQDGSTKDVNKG